MAQRKERLLILGASVRAAAQSAAAAGYELIAADQFADRDLREICPDARPVKYPEGLLEFAMTVEPCAWMYTGGLENYPEIVEKISQRHELLGNGAEVLRRVRNPRELAAFAEQGRPCLFPEICFGNPSANKQWLVKRAASGGGLGVRIATATTRLAPGEFFQEYVEGLNMSVSYLAANGVAKVIYPFGQYVDYPLPGAPRYHYCGGMTGVRDGEPSFPFFDLPWMDELGNRLASDFSLRGVFGVDLITNSDGIWLLEVNPRFTASMGLFDRFFQRSLIGFHVDAVRQSALPESWPTRNGRTFRASVVLYARAAYHVTDRVSDRLWAMRSELDLADLPMAESAIAKGCPVLTIYAQGDTGDEIIQSFEEKVSRLRALGIP